MPIQPSLGEFELVVLLAVLHITESDGLAYGSPVRNEIERRGKRRVTRGAVYVTLDRLEDKGFLASRLARGTAVREHKPKRVFTLTATGLKAVQESLALFARMQSGLAVARVKP